MKTLSSDYPTAPADNSKSKVSNRPGMISQNQVDKDDFFIPEYTRNNIIAALNHVVVTENQTFDLSLPVIETPTSAPALTSITVEKVIHDPTVTQADKEAAVVNSNETYDLSVKGKVVTHASIETMSIKDTDGNIFATHTGAELGHGNFGSVFVGQCIFANKANAEHGKYYAVKYLRPDPNEDTSTFVEDIRHENKISQVVGLGVSDIEIKDGKDTSFVVVMQLAPGKNLREYCDEDLPSSNSVNESSTNTSVIKKGSNLQNSNSVSGTTVQMDPNASGTTVQMDPNASGTTVQTNPNTSSTTVQMDPNASGTTVQMDPNASGTTVQMDPNASGTTVQINPIASTVQMDPNASGTTVQMNPNASGTTVQMDPTVLPQSLGDDQSIPAVTTTQSNIFKLYEPVIPLVKPDAARLEALFDIAESMTESVEQVHAANVVHLDIKEENFRYDPKTHKAQLIDFGTAHYLDDPPQHGVFIVGTPEFIAPELLQVQDSAGLKLSTGQDIYSLGRSFESMLREDYIAMAGKQISPQRFAPPPCYNDITFTVFLGQQFGFSSASGFKLPHLKEFEFANSKGDPHITALNSMNVLIHEMLEIDPSKRPSATVVKEKIHDIRVNLQNTLTQTQAAQTQAAQTQAAQTNPIKEQVVAPTISEKSAPASTQTNGHSIKSVAMAEHKSPILFSHHSPRNSVSAPKILPAVSAHQEFHVPNAVTHLNSVQEALGKFQKQSQNTPKAGGKVTSLLLQFERGQKSPSSSLSQSIFSQLADYKAKLSTQPESAEDIYKKVHQIIDEGLIRVKGAQSPKTPSPEIEQLKSLLTTEKEKIPKPQQAKEAFRRQ